MCAIHLNQEALTANKLQPPEMKHANKISPQGTGNSYNADLKLTSALQCIGTCQSGLMKATEWQAVTLSSVTTAACFFCFVFFLLFLLSKPGFVPWFLQQKHLLRSGILIWDLQKLL